MTKLITLVLILAVSACAKAPVPSSSNFLADNEFVIEMEHDTSGALVNVSTYGPVPHGQSCEQFEAVTASGTEKYNPKGFRSQLTCLQVKFLGPLGPKGAVILQPSGAAPLKYALIAVMYSKMGAYVGMQPLHAVKKAATCQAQARDLIDSNRKDGKVPFGASLLIYCLPVPALPTDKTLPNGDGVI
ncbi:MAG: hypothetical protein WBW93_16475 [Steroidobacteraceae bacterium]